MRRRPPAGAILATVIGALLAAACGGNSSAGSGSDHTRHARPTATTGVGDGSNALRVSPSPAHPRSEIAFSFTAPAASGRHGSSEISYSVSITGPSSSGCVGIHEAGGPTVSAGQPARVTVGPDQLGSPWCAGDYTARAFELSRAACVTGQPCPQYIRVVAVVGRTAFRVTRS